MKEFSSYSSPDARDFSYATSDLSEIQRTLVALVEKMTGQSRLINRYQDFLMNNQGADQFWQDVIDALELNVCVQNTGATTIPESGPLLVVANHPFGLVDGAAIAHLIDTVRRDFKIVCWDIFDHPPHISDYLLPMDLSEGTSARKQNIKVRRRAIDELNAGGAIIVFP
ncbi:MAG: hypothetical protein KTR18_11585, partial [Acidiferrobacterales bacterium]|nr:hypothetical protein [Acidiferrobacterales bacterium]